METFAYLHLAHAYESPTTGQPPHPVQPARPGYSLRRSLFSLLVPVVMVLSVPAIAQAQVLQFDDQGPEVESVQSDLSRLGYPITVDGVYGDNTVSIVEQFQSESGLLVDGQVGPDTRRALDQALRRGNSGSAGSLPPASWRTNTPPANGSSPLLRRGDTGNNVRLLQQQLCNRRYRCPVSGQFDQETEQAVIQFQQDQRLAADGVVGPKTWAALGIRQGNYNTASLRQYIVLIPMDTGVKLAEVRRLESGALEQRGSKLGSYIQVATYSDRAQAERKAKSLRSQGFDAQVRHF